ncbi:hypothetical protein Hanom_Chr14g01274891 [Helianthus anomalus]
MTSNRNMFKVFKPLFGVLTNEKWKEFSFIHGIEVRIPVDEKNITILCVNYDPSMKRNVLSLEQLLFEGIEVVKSSHSYTLKKMSGDRAKGKDLFEDKSEGDLVQEYLDKFYDNLDANN